MIVWNGRVKTVWAFWSSLYRNRGPGFHYESESLALDKLRCTAPNETLYEVKTTWLWKAAGPVQCSCEHSEVSIEWPNPQKLKENGSHIFWSTERYIKGFPPFGTLKLGRWSFTYGIGMPHQFPKRAKMRTINAKVLVRSRNRGTQNSVPRSLTNSYLPYGV